MRSRTSDENPRIERFHRVEERSELRFAVGRFSQHYPRLRAAWRERLLDSRRGRAEGRYRWAAASLIVASLLAGATYAVSRLSQEPGEGGTVLLDPGAASIHLDLRTNRVLVETEGHVHSLATSRDRLGTRLSFRPRGLAIADFGGDGRMVVAVSDFSNDVVMIIPSLDQLDASRWPTRTPAIEPSQPLSPGPAALVPPVPALVPLVPGSIVSVPAGPRGLLVADLDGDGRDDLAVASSVAQVVSVFLGRGREAIELADSIEVHGIPVAVSVAPPRAFSRRLADTSAFARKGPSGAAIAPDEELPAAAGSGEEPAVLGRFAGALQVTLADGAVLRYRSLGGGRFDHHAETVRRAEDSNVDPRNGDGGATIRPETNEAADATNAAADADTLEVATITTPDIDFAALGNCASSLPMPAKKIAAVVKLVTKAQAVFEAAAAGTNTKKFAMPAALLNRYIATINGQVGISIDQAAADTCVVPAQEDVDAILLIGTPASLAVDGGNDQTARPFARLPLPLTVKAADVYGNGTRKVAVSFAVVSGTAKLGATKATTGTDGKTSTTLTFLGPPDGDVEVQATVGTAAPVLLTQHKVTGTISLATDVQPIFTGNCAFSGCHAGLSPQQGQDLSPGNLYNPTTGIVGVTSHEAPPLLRVNPGHPESSYLVNKIEGTQGAAGGFGVQMPRGRPALPQASRFLIETWIAQGAPNN